MCSNILLKQVHRRLSHTCSFVVENVLWRTFLWEKILFICGKNVSCCCFLKRCVMSKQFTALTWWNILMIRKIIKLFNGIIHHRHIIQIQFKSSKSLRLTKVFSKVKVTQRNAELGHLFVLRLMSWSFRHHFSA